MAASTLSLTASAVNSSESEAQGALKSLQELPPPARSATADVFCPLRTGVLTHYRTRVAFVYATRNPLRS